MNDDDKSLLHSWVMTTWDGVFNGRGEGADAKQARHSLLLRYHEAVYHFFLRKIRDPHAAHELYSNFAVKLIESDRLLKRADPARGRFRNYLKTALHHMVIDYYRARKADGKVGRIVLDPAEHDVASDDEFSAEVWPQELLNQAWKALQNQERQTGQPHYTVLRCQSDNPGVKAPQLAERLTALLDKAYTPESIRQALHRAREKFAGLLLEEVERTLESPTPDELEAELIDLKLLSYCQKALEKRRKS